MTQDKNGECKEKDLLIMLMQKCTSYDTNVTTFLREQAMMRQDIRKILDFRAKILAVVGLVIMAAEFIAKLLIK